MSLDKRLNGLWVAQWYVKISFETVIYDIVVDVVNGILSFFFCNPIIYFISNVVSAHLNINKRKSTRYNGNSLDIHKPVRNSVNN